MISTAEKGCLKPALGLQKTIRTYNERISHAGNTVPAIAQTRQERATNFIENIKTDGAANPAALENSRFRTM